jgi:hypothetical protein
MVQWTALGLVTGYLSGLFGVGGGVLMVPVLVFALGMPQRLAHGTSLAAVIPIACAGVVGYAVDDQIDYGVAALLVLGSAAGAVLGTRLLRALSVRWLRISFAVMLLATAARLFVHVESGDPRRTTLAVAVVIVVIGVLTGVVSGLLGVGGGIFMVPAMMIVIGIPAVVAKGVSLLVVIPTALIATWRNVRSDLADIRAAAVLGLTGAVTAYAGALTALHMAPRLAAALFAAFLVVVAGRMLWGAVRAPAEK